mmetsp:Transcript_16186/g.40921  ORF Transcript_16186/g.40921 Transcript_16186/m.40921 type:complete len:326 (-) Transcript_16186:28-1005(-)
MLPAFVPTRRASNDGEKEREHTLPWTQGVAASTWYPLTRTHATCPSLPPTTTCLRVSAMALTAPSHTASQLLPTTLLPVRAFRCTTSPVPVPANTVSPVPQQWQVISLSSSLPRLTTGSATRSSPPSSDATSSQSSILPPEEHSTLGLAGLKLTQTALEALAVLLASTRSSSQSHTVTVWSGTSLRTTRRGLSRAMSTQTTPSSSSRGSLAMTLPSSALVTNTQGGETVLRRSAYAMTPRRGLLAMAVTPEPAPHVKFCTPTSSSSPLIEAYRMALPQAYTKPVSLTNGSPPAGKPSAPTTGRSSGSILSRPRPQSLSSSSNPPL